MHQEKFRLYLLSELFNFTGMHERIGKFAHHLPNIQQEIFDVAEKLSRQLPGYPDDRISRAANYFKEKLEAVTVHLHSLLGNLVGSSKDLAGRADGLLQWIVNRSKLLETFSSVPFSTETYLQLFKEKQKIAVSYLKALNARPNEPLFEELLEWRNVSAQKEQLLPGMLFSEQTLATIAAKLPATLKALSAVKGVGPEKTARYGAALLLMIRTYQQESSGAADQASLF
ncbi:MAG TPA: hypothetical protein ENO28_13015 [Bacteroidetes bacterium]|nr:hypothetical protein [Bacteroidota bacterium]